MLKKRQIIINKKSHNNDLAIGSRVFVRDRCIKGRNKIQDKFAALPYIVIERPDPSGNVYRIAEADGNGKIKTVNRNELFQPPFLKPDSDSESDSDSDLTDSDSIVLRKVNYPSMRNFSDQTDYSSDNSIRNQEVCNYPLRRSKRKTAGKHSNPYNLPKSCIE